MPIPQKNRGIMFEFELPEVVLLSLIALLLGTAGAGHFLGSSGRLVAWGWPAVFVRKLGWIRATAVDE